MDLLGGGQEQAQLTSTQREMMATVKSTMAKAHDTDEVSARTAEIVQSQGEQIDRINENSQQIESNLDTSSWLLKGLSSWGGRMRNAWTGQPKKDLPKPPNSTSTSSSSERTPSRDVASSKPTASKTSVPPSHSDANQGTASGAQQQQQQQQKSQFDSDLDKHLDGLRSTVATITPEVAQEIPEAHDVDTAAHAAVPAVGSSSTVPSSNLYPSAYGMYGGGGTGLYGGTGGLYGSSMYGGYGGGLYSGGGYYPGGLQGMPGQQDLWFTQTAESLGRFNQMLEMHTMFLDQIYHHCGMIYARATDLVSWLKGVLNYVRSGKLEEKNIELVLDRLGQLHRTPQEELAGIRRRVRVLMGFAALVGLWIVWKRHRRQGSTAGVGLQAAWDSVHRRS
ncbi:hypothetical protein FOL47_007707 [Perkinsus chesapeaki]|uniref:t-SNARE coiled-coil homology domain-containing protein n=1 Tax=Perkinsus chesapeaki TaxID=330153 RepID=A0A7J6LIM4_PERCH|nr:hypothetical protein FOL47_007707 [Perkinsus chesapeaki]